MEKNLDKKALLSAFHPPDVREYRRSLGDEIPLVNIVRGGNVWDS